MTHSSTQSEPTFLLASLAALSVGTWDYDILHDCLRYCRTFATLYGLPPERGEDGLSMNRIAAATHPDDRARARAKRMHVLQHGGVFVLEYRVLSSPTETRWLLVRGFYEPDSEGQVIRGRGIVVDVTEGKEEGFAEGEVFFVTEADDKAVNALDRATKYVLAARRAIDELGSAGAGRLQPATNTLLLEIGKHIAGTLIPVMPRRTDH